MWGQLWRSQCSWRCGHGHYSEPAEGRRSDGGTTGGTAKGAEAPHAPKMGVGSERESIFVGRPLQDPMKSVDMIPDPMKSVDMRSDAVNGMDMKPRTP